MIKHLLTCAALVAASFTASATEITIWEGTCEFGTKWAGSVGIPSSDLTVLDSESAVLTLHYTLDTECTYWQYKMCSNGTGWNPLEVSTELGNDYQCISLEAGSTKTDCPLGATDIATIKANGLRIQGYGATLNKITYVTDKVIDENLLWEGELSLDNWSGNGAEINASKVKVGDVLKYTFSEPGTGSQVNVKASNWSDLLGTSQFASADIATGSVIVGVTTEMLENCNGKFFIQGTGGFTLTKVERIGNFDATNVIVYGERICGVSVFTVLPATAKKLDVTFKEAPEWAQLCNSSWTDLNAENTVKNNSDGSVTYSFTLTDNIIANINEKKQLIINSANTTKVLSVSISSDDPAGIADIVVDGDENAPVEYFNLQGIRVENPENGLYIRRQGNKVSKVLVK